MRGRGLQHLGLFPVSPGATRPHLLPRTNDSGQHTHPNDSNPREHNLLRVEIAETVFERRVGGYLYDRGVDGSECRWARVLAYEPPRRLVFSWNISPAWQIETDLEETSEVEVRFIPEGENRTRVSLEQLEASP